MQSSQGYITCRERIVNAAISEASTQITNALEDLKDQIMEDVVERFRNALDEAISDGEMAETERAEFEDRVSDLETELEEARARIKELEDEVSELQTILQPRLAV